MWPCLTDAARHDTACHDNLASAHNLIRLAMGIITAMGLFIPWMIFRCIIHPLISIESTLRRVNQGDVDARITIQAGRELNTLTYEINKMLQMYQQDQELWQNIHQTQGAVSAVRHMMLHETNENGLIQACCNIFVESGRYRMAQIHFVGENPDVAMSVAQAINQSENHKFVSNPTINSTVHPTVRALRNQHIAMIANVFEDSADALFQADAERIGYTSIIAVPISANRQPIGALTLFVEKPGAFSVEIVQLLTELADDLGHQIQTIRFSSLTKKP
jgi:transcriptional regulator with GAF, ATPase, and Fis domain